MLRWLRRIDPATRHAAKRLHGRDFLLRKIRQRGVCAEIGVYKGDFSERILTLTRPRRLHLIDPWLFESGETYAGSLYGSGCAAGQGDLDAIFESVKERFEHEIRVGTVMLHREPSAAAAESFPDDYFDWIYIDGNHQYEFVKSDLERYWPKIKAGGFVTGDDYGTRGWWRDGVTRAVNEFAAQGKCGPLLVRNHQFILRKKRS